MPTRKKTRTRTRRQRRRRTGGSGDSAYYAKLRRVHNSPDAVFRALDVRDLKHRRDDHAAKAESSAPKKEQAGAEEDRGEGAKDKEKGDGAAKGALWPVLLVRGDSEHCALAILLRDTHDLATMPL
jgi:hypothetical protein